MQYLVYVMLALGIAATTLFLYVRVKKGGVPALLAKIAASVFFILTAITAGIANPNVPVSFWLLIVCGGLFGLLGDILLDLKVIYPQHNNVYLYAGMSVFAIGHICFLTAIYLNFAFNAVTLAVPIAISVVFALAAVLGGPLMKLNYGKFKVPSLIYAFLLSFMMFSCGAAAIATGFKPIWIMMFVGGFMFVFSDLVLSQMYFTVGDGKDEFDNPILPKAKTPSLVIVNHATYYIAQFLIAAAILLF